MNEAISTAQVIVFIVILIAFYLVLKMKRGDQDKE